MKNLSNKCLNLCTDQKELVLRAPQIGQSIRLFIIDASPYRELMIFLLKTLKVFINPKIIEETGNEWLFNEGCLSVPGINEDVKRKEVVEIEYQDENFEWHREKYSGIIGRIIQHEYDHLDGKLFVDRLSPLVKTLIKGKLAKISKGNVDVSYKMIFNKK